MVKVLIVEGDLQASGAVARVLNARGYRTRVESNGASALLAAHEELPDVIIMDIVMPILQGESAIQALRGDSRTAHIPIVILSTRNDDRAWAEALAAGANAFMTKPPDPQELLSFVERLASLREQGKVA